MKLEIWITATNKQRGLVKIRRLELTDNDIYEIAIKKAKEYYPELKYHKYDCEIGEINF